MVIKKRVNPLLICNFWQNPVFFSICHEINRR
jgi:hypothetical protein